MNTIIESGWCAFHLLRGCAIGARCVSGPGGEYCLTCARRDLGLPGTATEEEIVEAANRVTSQLEGS